jgi:hypothetical protein
MGTLLRDLRSRMVVEVEAQGRGLSARYTNREGQA